MHEQVARLIKSNERLAAAQEVRANNVFELGMRIGWDERSMATGAELRLSVEAHRMLADEVRSSLV
jgi:hypothetical protein